MSTPGTGAAGTPGGASHVTSSIRDPWKVFGEAFGDAAYGLEGAGRRAPSATSVPAR